MATFTHVPSEFDLRLQVQQAFFLKYHCSIEDNRVDFIVASDKNSLFQQSFLWAESKMSNIPLDTMFAQLLLTIKPLQNSGEILPPKFLGVFNKSQMSFIEYHNILDIFNLNDLNWNDHPFSQFPHSDENGDHQKDDHDSKNNIQQHFLSLDL